MEAVVDIYARDAVVIDANLALALVLPLPYVLRATELYDQWILSRVPLYVPLLWEYEVTSSVRKAVALSAIASVDGDDALERVLRLSVKRITPDRAMNASALVWAERLGQIAAFDAQYVALAERLGAELWTADRRLANKAGNIGASFVHCLSL
jgi:predicted nucleic acid-binding protein